MLVSISMDHSEILRKQIEKKEREVNGLEKKMIEAKAALQALLDVKNAAEQAENDNQAAEGVIRAGSSVDQARRILLDKSKPMHVDAILEAMGKDVTKASKASLNSSISAYARRKEIFIQTGPATYGLTVFNEPEPTEEEPPIDFGKPAAPPPDINFDDDFPF